MAASVMHSNENKTAPTAGSSRQPTKTWRLSTTGEFRERFENDVKAGLTRLPQPWFPSKYRYDAEGSVLFERIIQQPEYYLNKVETEILAREAVNILRLTSPDELIELGSGSSTKTRLLIQAMRVTGCKRYVPMDISESALQEAADALTTDYDWLQVQGLIGDYDHDLPKIRRDGRRLFAMFGTTLCNYTSKQECMKFVKKIKAAMTKGDSLVVGIDLLKDVSVISPAYDDKAGANKAFKLHALDILNREFGSDFCKTEFELVTRWNPVKSAVESLLCAKRDMTVSIPSLEMKMSFSTRNEILVGISCKFKKEEFSQELTAVGLHVAACYTDNAGGFGIFVACCV